MAQALRLHLPGADAQALAAAAATPAAPAIPFELPPDAVRHVQVRRLQPGDPVQLFDGRGNEWLAELLAMGRHSAQVRVLHAVTALPELPWRVTLAVAVPANDRMDSVVEKATELGVHAIQPLVSQHSVLRLDAARAAKRVAHWQAVAAAAAEQCGRAWVPQVAAWQALAPWLSHLAPGGGGARWLLAPGAEQALAAQALPSPAAAPTDEARTVLCLSGPEGGLSAAEETQAQACGFARLSLGPRVLRADTAPLAVMAWIALHAA